MHIHTVESNIKGGVSLELGQRTLLLGRNGGGKSSVVQAIDLAVRGCVRDGEGRDEMKLLGAIARFFPENTKEMSSSVMLSDGQTEYAWAAKNDGKTIKTTLKKHADMAGGEVNFLFEKVQGVLAKEPAQVRAWLSNFVLGKLQMKDVANVLTPAEFTEIELMVKVEGTEVDWNTLSKAAKSRATSLRKEATIKEKTIESLTEGADTPMTDEEIAKVRRKIDELSTSAIQGNLVNSEIKTLTHRIEQAAAWYDTQQEKVATSSVSHLGMENYQFLVSMQEMLRRYLTLLPDNGCCEVCGATELPPNALTNRRQQVDKLVDNMAAAKQVIDLKNKLAETEAAIEAEVRRLQALQAVDVDVIISERDRLNMTLANQVAARRSWDNTRAVRIEINTLRTRANVLTSASDMLAEVGQKKLAQAVNSFCEDVDRYLAREKVGIDIDAGRIGFQRSGRGLHTALSGGEWTSLVLALAAAAHDRDVAARGREGLALLVPEDRAWDAKTLTSVMIALSDFEGQVILMSTVYPEDWTDSSDWKIIHVG
jgi:hypothetical protein